VAANAEDLYRVSRADYLAGELVAFEKSEWVDGIVYAMSSGTKAHAAVASRLIHLLYEAAQSRGCFIASSDVLVETAAAFYYPDVVVSCHPDDDPRIERRPCFIAEVLSPSTKRADRQEKRLAYGEIPSMQDYWIVDPDTKVIEVWTRQDTGWSGRHFAASDEITVRCLNRTLTVFDIVGV
jgi:Uma2 family endonuclease